MDSIYFVDYAENVDEIISQTDNSLFELLTQNKISKTFSDYIANSYNNGVISQLCLSEKILSIINQYEEKNREDCQIS